LALLAVADELKKLSEGFERNHKETLEPLLEAAIEMHNAWSGSNMGYHAFVYYGGLQARPPGAQFSAEWGLMEKFGRMGSVGDWQEFNGEEVKKEIRIHAGNPDLSEAKKESAVIAQEVERLKGDVISILTLSVKDSPDELLTHLLGEAKDLEIFDQNALGHKILPHGKMMSRDANAIQRGVQLAPHQEIVTEISALKMPADIASKFSDICRKSGSHILRMEKCKVRAERVGANVFIGHGGSPLWRELKDFIVDRLKLPHEEFNRVPVAGITNVARLSEMLDGSTCALVVLTAEDEQNDGALHARMNVIHEVGLFQGRLGFTKAIIILEDGCEEFSNIQGLGQIRFPTGNISAAFEKIRAVLEREEIIMS